MNVGAVLSVGGTTTEGLSGRLSTADTSTSPTIPASWLPEAEVTSTGRALGAVYWGTTDSPGRPRLTNAQSDNLRARVDDAKLPESVLAEGAAEPTPECRSLAKALSVELWRKFALVPERVAANVEDGITLYFRNHRAGRSLVVEAYNTGEIAALVDQAGTILAAKDIGGEDDPALDGLARLFWQSPVPESPQAPGAQEAALR